MVRGRSRRSDTIHPPRIYSILYIHTTASSSQRVDFSPCTASSSSLPALALDPLAFSGGVLFLAQSSPHRIHLLAFALRRLAYVALPFSGPRGLLLVYHARTFWFAFLRPSPPFFRLVLELLSRSLFMMGTLEDVGLGWMGGKTGLASRLKGMEWIGMWDRMALVYSVRPSGIMTAGTI